MKPEVLAALPARVRVILAAGAIRSGSTPIFNIARLLLKQAGEPFTAGWIDDISELPEETALIKIHEWHPELAERANVVLTCHRDLREVARSLAAIGWLRTGSEAFEQIDNIVRNQTQWKVVAALDIGYENMIRDWNATVAKLASVLGVDESCANFDAIAREVSEMSGPTAFIHGRRYDPITLMHRNHKSGENVQYSEIEKEIHQRFLRWQLEHGYK